MITPAVVVNVHIMAAGLRLTIDLNTDIVSILSKSAMGRQGFVTDPLQLARQGPDQRQAEQG